jgi:hypothetical protein
MIYIDLDNYEPSEDWLNRADDLTKQLRVAINHEDRNLIIQQNENMWGELKLHFANVRKRKCWYSESVNDFAHCHIDHFRPKLRALHEANTDQGGYWWLAFDWMNYRYAGPAGNIRKRDYFNVFINKANLPDDAIENEDIYFLDPAEPEDPGKLKYNNEGVISPKATDEASRAYIQAEYTIRRMNLNMIGLVEGRKGQYRKTYTLIRQTQDLLAKQTANFDLARRQSIKAKQKELLELASRLSPYSAAVKYCLKESGFDWATELAISA